jgi:hypothetical protein
MAFGAQIERTADHIGPEENIWDIYDLPPTVVGREQYGPRHRPVNDVPDPGGWRPGMPYGQQAWGNYEHTDLIGAKSLAPILFYFFLFVLVSTYK